jgi:hypothetical protein
MSCRPANGETCPVHHARSCYCVVELTTPGGRYRRRPTDVSAVQWRGDNLDEIRAFFPGGHMFLSEVGTLHIYVAPEDQWMRVPRGHVIVTPDGRKAHPVDPLIFSQTYDSAG